MPKVYGHDRDTASRLRNIARRTRRDPRTPELVLLPKGDDGNSAFFRLMEDVTSSDGAFWARRTNRLNTELGAWTQVYNWDDILGGAVAGYHALYNRVSGEWVIAAGACIPAPCEHEGAIIVGEPPEGTVEVGYPGHTLSVTSVTDLTANGLPDGMTMDTAGEITGTPTEAGTFYVTITGLSGVDNCELTRIMVLTIAEA